MTQYVNEKVEKMERPIIAWALLTVIGALGLAYAFFVAGAIVNVVSAKEASAKAAALTSVVGELEAEYIASKSSIDLAYAANEGFSEPESGTIYVAKRGGTPLSINR